jgi:hypothetical protein
MTAGELKKKLELVDDDVVVVTHGSDHSYNTAGYCGPAPAELSRRCRYYEWYGKEMLFKIVVKEKGKVIEEALVSLSDERHMLKLRAGIEDMYNPEYGYEIFFHPQVQLTAMHATGSFNHLPIEERKKSNE